jgi:deoxyribose-phosphate aldolase
MKNLKKKLSGYYKAVDEVRTAEKVKEYVNTNHNTKEKIELIKFAVSLIDLTTLEGSDTKLKVQAMCETAKTPISDEKNFPHCAAVCIYPILIRYAKKGVKGSKVKIASVATAFPSGQFPLKLKLADVKYCIEEGAKEIDMVISRGEFLSGNYELVFDEIQKVKNICKKKKVHLKVILETGELKTPDNIRKASFLAMLAGADFIKTSTGKIPVAATLTSVLIMSEAIKEFYEKTGIKVGIKAAGGIRTTEEVFSYIALVKDVLGEEWLTPELFRIGASSLLNDLLKQYLVLTRL